MLPVGATIVNALGLRIWRGETVRSQLWRDEGRPHAKSVLVTGACLAAVTCKLIGNVAATIAVDWPGSWSRPDSRPLRVAFLSRRRLQVLRLRPDVSFHRRNTCQRGLRGDPQCIPGVVVVGGP